VIVIGCDKSSNKLKKFIVTNPYLGFKNLGYFTDEKSNSKDYLGRIDEAQEFILENKVDEIYCSLSLVKKEKIKELIWFAKANQRKIKLIPDAREIFSKNLSLQYYGTLPIFRIKNFPFEYAEIRFVKRVFDILFSFFICLTILSWLVPLLFILIKLESKGPLFFKQKRHGLSGKEFSCYKFRSMNTNSEAHKKSATKDDDRITRIGNFIRKTSIDELPQFLNVLKGDMSVVGPRPHMIKQSEDFENKIDNYIKRNAVKPGITGLAQVSGYRGEIQKKSDIENRVRLDIFYIENWSFLLDIKIIYKTLISVFKGEENAY
jgi:putative colanic acid biosynthesis UDP-glucose lipid carrier transferase